MQKIEEVESVHQMLKSIIMAINFVDNRACTDTELMKLWISACACCNQITSIREKKTGKEIELFIIAEGKAVLLMKKLYSKIVIQSSIIDNLNVSGILNWHLELYAVVKSGDTEAAIILAELYRLLDEINRYFLFVAEGLNDIDHIKKEEADNQAYLLLNRARETASKISFTYWGNKENIREWELFYGYATVVYRKIRHKINALFELNHILDNIQMNRDFGFNSSNSSGGETSTPSTPSDSESSSSGHSETPSTPSNSGSSDSGSSGRESWD